MCCSNKKANIRLAGKLEKGSGPAELKAINEIAMLEPKQFDSHLASDHFHIRLATQIAQLLNRRHAIVLDGFFHQDGG